MPIANILVVLTVGVVGYVWSSRGFFSALLHLCCTIAAGAIALAVWEPLALTLMPKVGPALGDIVWGAALAVPFALSVAVLTITVNLVVRANAQCESVFDYLGGAVCGAIIGILVAGFAVISLSFVRSKPDYLGYTPITQEKKGFLVNEGGLWVPADKLTAMLYGTLSSTTLTTGEPLARLYPDLHLRGHIYRHGPTETLIKHIAKPDEVGLFGWYAVGLGGKLKINELLADTVDPVKQDYRDLLGESPSPSGQYQINGYIIGTKDGLREKQGQIVLGPGSATLIVESAEDDSMLTIQPMALISQAKGENNGKESLPTTRIGRWRFDASDTFFSSGGTASNPPVCFEFLVPVGARPVALYVKGIRLPLIDPETEEPLAPLTNYDDVASRDAAVSTRDMFAAVAGSSPVSSTGSRLAMNTGETPIRASNRLPFNLTLNMGSAGNLQTIKEGRNNYITGGTSSFGPGDMLKLGDDRSLRLELFATDGETVVVMVDVGPKSAISLASPESKGASGAFGLIDSLGQRHSAVGYVYKDTRTVSVRYTLGAPLGSSNDLPVAITNNRDDQQCVLIFRLPLGVSVKSYVIGETGISELAPPLKLDQSQKR
ncbi:MAG: hypothetical protein ACT4PL_09205 [Phycisphaerales bacterium]